MDDPFFHNGDEMEDGAYGECPQRHAKQMLAAAYQGQDRVQQAQGVQRGSYAQPDDAHFSHDDPVT